jgi:hypothetical protein
MSTQIECAVHEFVQTHCVNCGGFIGEVCQICGHLSDGGDWMASQEDIWCRCSDSVADYDFENGIDYGEQDDYHYSQHMEPNNE